MKIYTRTGDAGTTSLVGGKRVSKASERLNAYGTVDELNSAIGMLLTYPELTADDQATLLMIQNKLFNAGAYLATDNSDTPGLMPAGLDTTHIQRIEQQIDAVTATLPPQTAFILPGGCPAAAMAHICRTICRRAERQVVKLSEVTEVDTTVQRFLNRLSDYLFTLSRAINHRTNTPEKQWQK